MNYVRLNLTLTPVKRITWVKYFNGDQKSSTFIKNLVLGENFEKNRSVMTYHWYAIKVVAIQLSTELSKYKMSNYFIMMNTV